MIVTSFEIVMADIKPLSKYAYKYIVVDEGHRWVMGCGQGGRAGGGPGCAASLHHPHKDSTLKAKA